MLFNSLVFALFLPSVFLVYWMLQRTPLRYQNTLLLVASYVFYGWWDWRFLSLIFFSSCIDYWTGARLATAQNERHRKLLLGLSLLVNLGALGFFKYYNFFVNSFVELLHSMGLQANPWSLR